MSRTISIDINFFLKKTAHVIIVIRCNYQSCISNRRFVIKSVRREVNLKVYNFHNIIKS